MSSASTQFATRTEVEVIADTIVALYRGNLFAKTTWNIHEAARLSKVTVRAVMEADERWTRRRLSVPAERPVLAHEPAKGPEMPHRPQNQAMPTRKPKERLWVTAGVVGVGGGRGSESRTTTGAVAAVSTSSSRQPINGSSGSGCRPESAPTSPSSDETAPIASDPPDRLICSKCGNKRKADEFHGSTTVCRLCVWRKARRTRYLREVGAVVLAAHDELVGSACVVCGDSFQPGQFVKATDVLLAHEGCEGS